MSWERHHRVLPTTFSFAVYILLLIHHGGSKCVHKTARHLNKEGCVNYCPSADQCPEECIHCVSGFYGPDCRRSCRGHCLNGRCALLANGRAVNCTEGCVLGWRGLTCNTRCKRPCLECDRYTGDCVGQCRDGFYGPGCLQRCPYTCSKCDKISGKCLNSSDGSDLNPKKNDMPVALSQTHGNNRRNIHTSNINKSHSSREYSQQSAAELTPDCGRRQSSSFFNAGVAVLAAVTAVIIVSVIGLKRQRKTDSVWKPHTCEESHRFLDEKSNIISVIPASHSDEGRGSGPETSTKEMSFLSRITIKSWFKRVNECGLTPLSAQSGQETPVNGNT